jgi:hypothetical protein
MPGADHGYAIVPLKILELFLETAGERDIVGIHPREVLTARDGDRLVQ